MVSPSISLKNKDRRVVLHQIKRNQNQGNKRTFQYQQLSIKKDKFQSRHLSRAHVGCQKAKWKLNQYLLVSWKNLKRSFVLTWSVIIINHCSQQENFQVYPIPNWNVFLCIRMMKLLMRGIAPWNLYFRRHPNGWIKTRNIVTFSPLPSTAFHS